MAHVSLGHARDADGTPSISKGDGGRWFIENRNRTGKMTGRFVLMHVNDALVDGKLATGQRKSS